METGPILRALMHNKTSFVLIALQIAVIGEARFRREVEAYFDVVVLDFQCAYETREPSKCPASEFASLLILRELQ